MENKHSSPDGSYVHSFLNEGVYTIRWHHPQGNSLTSAMLKNLVEEINAADQTDLARVVVLSSSGPAFCGGASFNELLEVKDEQNGLQFFSGFANLISAMRNCRKFMIARVHGKTVGGGVGVAAAADYTLAMNTAAIKLSELTLGIGPFVIAPAVERKIGTSALSELTIDAASWRTAAWAKEKGLYADVFEKEEELDAAIHALTKSLSGYSPTAMAEVKKVLWQNTEHWETLLQERAAQSGKLVLSQHSQRFLHRFRNKTEH